MKRKPTARPSALFPKLSGRRVILTFHSQGDLDAVGSAIALYHYFGKKAVIAPPDRPTASARRLLEKTGVPTTLFSELKITPKDAIIVLDSSSPHLLSHLAGIKPDMLIDHHSRFGGEITAQREIVDPEASATCEIIHFMIKPTDSVSCTALLAGILEDSAHFKYATVRTFEAAGALLERCGAGYDEILSLTSVPESLGERIEALRSCKSVSAERIGEHIVATALAKSHTAHFADILTSLGADMAFVGCEGEENRLSARMRNSLKGRVRLDRIMFEVGHVLGGTGSGHELAAGASGNSGNVRAALGICVKLAEQQLLSTEHAKIKKIEW